MPWEKKFDNEEVLDKAMHAFWVRGYEATSIQDLTRCMGINRGSLYATFRDKRNLFLLALEHYESRYRRKWLMELRRNHSPRVAIETLFETAVETVLSDKKRSGCMLVNTATEMAAHDADIARAVAQGLAEIEAYLEKLIRQGQKHGDIADHIDPNATANALLALLVGLRVMARCRPEREALKPLAQQAAALLN